MALMLEAFSVDQIPKDFNNNSRLRLCLCILMWLDKRNLPQQWNWALPGGRKHIRGPVREICSHRRCGGGQFPPWSWRAAVWSRLWRRAWTGPTWPAGGGTDALGSRPATTDWCKKGIGLHYILSLFFFFFLLNPLSIKRLRWQKTNCRCNVTIRFLKGFKRLAMFHFTRLQSPNTQHIH